jgi:putative transcriptional regulator
MTASKPNRSAIQGAPSEALASGTGPGSASMYSTTFLANQLLLAMPGMLDDNFAGSLIYLFEHNEKGAMGLVVNRPTETYLSTLLEKIELQSEIKPFADQLVYFGGPVQVERGFILHESDVSPYNSSLSVPGGLTMTTSKDVLEAVASGDGPRRFIMTLGYSGWGAGQLEEEIGLNGWINVALSRQQMAEIIFATPAALRYERTMQALGFDPSHLSGEVGHA